MYILGSGIIMNKADKESPLSMTQDCWPNSVVCDYRNEVPVTLLVVSQEIFSAPQGCLHSLSHCPLHFQTSKVDFFSNFESL